MPTDSKDKTENEEYSDSDAGRPVDSEDRVQPPKPPMTEREKRRESGIPDTMMSGQGLPKAGGTPAGNAIPQYRHDRRRKEDEAPPPRRSAKENTGSQKQQVYENNTRYKAGFFHADGQNILNPITFVSSTFHVVTKAPFSSLAFLATLAIYTLGCRELGELVVFSSNDRSNAKRDLSANQKIFANLFAKSWLSPTGVFVLLNLWMFVGIVPVTLLLSFAITRADTPRKANANAWWRNPARSTRGVLSGIKSGLAGMVRVIAMDARLCGPRKFLRKSTWWTGLRIVLFLAQLVLTILLTRQALSLAYMVSTGSDKPFDTGPDTSSDTPALAAVAKSLTPVRMFAMLNFLLLFVITTLTVSWYALLHPMRPSTSTRRTGHSPGMILGIKTIGAIIIAIAFVSILFLFSDIASYTKNSLSAFTGANLVFGLFIPAMAWALLVFAEVLVKAWRTSGCKARPPQGSGDEAKASRSVSKKTKQ